MTEQEFYDTQSLYGDITELSGFVEETKEDVYKMSKRTTRCGGSPDLVSIIKHETLQLQLKLAEAKLKELNTKFEKL